MPPLSSKLHLRPVWQPLLAAAAVLIVLGAAAAVMTLSESDDEFRSAPPPTPSASVAIDDVAEPGALSTAPPTVPYVVGSRLFVAVEQVPGNDWAFVMGTDSGWVAGRFDGGDYTYFWGYDAQPHPMEGYMRQGPAVSPGGGYWASVVDQDSEGLLTGAAIAPGDESFGGTPIDLSDHGIYASVAAVTDDGLVITRAPYKGTPLLWRPLVDGKAVDLAVTAPDQVVLGSTEAGLLVVDAASANIDEARRGDVYLADISEDGEITRLGPVPNHDVLAASGAWLAWVQAGTLGGEVAAIAELRVQRIDGGDPGTLTPPEGWYFRPGAGTWEDDDHLVAVVVDEDDDRERLVRCSPDTETCVLLDTP